MCRGEGRSGGAKAKASRLIGLERVVPAVVGCGVGDAFTVREQFYFGVGNGCAQWIGDGAVNGGGMNCGGREPQDCAKTANSYVSYRSNIHSSVLPPRKSGGEEQDRSPDSRPGSPAFPK